MRGGWQSEREKCCLKNSQNWRKIGFDRKSSQNWGEQATEWGGGVGEDGGGGRADAGEGGGELAWREWRLDTGAHDDHDDDRDDDHGADDDD